MSTPMSNRSPVDSREARPATRGARMAQMRSLRRALLGGCLTCAFVASPGVGPAAQDRPTGELFRAPSWSSTTSSRPLPTARSSPATRSPTTTAARWWPRCALTAAAPSSTSAGARSSRSGPTWAPTRCSASTAWPSPAEAQERRPAGQRLGIRDRPGRGRQRGWARLHGRRGPCPPGTRGRHEDRVGRARRHAAGRAPPPRPPRGLGDHLGDPDPRRVARPRGPPDHTGRRCSRRSSRATC